MSGEPMGLPDAAASFEAPWRSWSPVERESFFTAIARHRRAAWRVTAACAVGYTVLVVVASVLMAPLLWCLAGLLVDLGNLVIPLPDLLGWAGERVAPLTQGAPLPLVGTIGMLAVAAAPGLLVMLALSRALTRVLTRSPLFAGEALGGRPPAMERLAEQRLANVTLEMAIAAGLEAPQLLIVPGGVNAAATGHGADVRILVGEQLLHRLDRSQMQGVLAHLIGSVADGDLRIGRRTAVTLALFAVIARLSGSFADREMLQCTLGLWRVLVRPDADNTAALLRRLADPFDGRTLAQTAPGGTPAGAVGVRDAAGSALTWREWAAMPLVGPLVIVGYLGGLVSELLLEPLVALAWRERKFMADATAVKLTRDPDALAGALAAMARSDTGLPAWATHLAVAGARPGDGGLLGGTIVSIFPSYGQRGHALVRLGASVTPARDGTRLHWSKLVLAVVLFSIIGVLLFAIVGLLVLLSIMLSMLFTALPAALLHELLRSLGQ